MTRCLDRYIMVEKPRGRYARQSLCFGPRQYVTAKWKYIAIMRGDALAKLVHEDWIDDYGVEINQNTPQEAC